MAAEGAALALGLGLAASACASPADRFAQRALALGFQQSVVPGTGFAHVLFRRSGFPAGTLHVYLGGDGTPWLAGRPAADPTPERPLELTLMALDRAPSVYLGRPCYHGLADTPPCAPPLWTSARYSDAVVQSIVAAAARVARDAGARRVVWLGYSGGGTLAVLAAPRLAASVAVVTIAANLDTDAWAELHGFHPLTGSLNPARQPPLGLFQRHYVGGRDWLVPEGVVRRGPIDGDSVRVVPDCDHGSCWEALWPAILEEVRRGAGEGG
ncbi:MAG: hypothetical protein HY615_16955 [Candidatus Rokubacteria bacterium]|nr:hypothetical protein [Candidatus Rokubacteria bacterium]